MHTIGLDVGTTGVKACVFDEDGVIRGYGFREYGIICTEPHMAEQDAELVWRLTGEVLKEAAAQAGAADIRALCLSVQGDAIIPIDNRFNPLYPAVLGMDYRSEPQARKFADQFGDRALFDLTGMRPHPMNSVVKMLWLKECRPSVFDSAWKIVTYADFITGKLCGEAVIDYTMASRTMAFDLAGRAWSADILKAIGIGPQRLSRPVQSGTVCGELTAAVARETGLPAGLPVVAGGHDQTCAAIGAGVVKGGRAILSSGTAEVLASAFTERVDRTMLYDSYYPQYIHAAPGAFFTFALNHSGGISFRWYRDNLGLPEKEWAANNGADPYTAIIERMPPGPSPVFVVPHFSGSPTPTCDMNARAAIVGMSFSTTRHDIAKAFLEGLTFELRNNVDLMKSAGIRVDDLVAVGGGAKSPMWLQMRADILGAPLRTLKVREAACLGAAILASTAAGIYGSVDEGVGKTVRDEMIFNPQPDMRKIYDDRFRRYLALYPALKKAAAIG